MKGTKIGYGVLLIVTLILAIVHNAYHIYLLLAVEVFMPVFLYLYVLYCKNCLSVELLTKKSSSRIGENVPLTIKLTNRGVFPIVNIQISVRYRNHYIHQWNNETIALSVSSNRTQLAEFSLLSEHCGLMELLITEAAVFDPLYMFRKSAELKQAKLSIAIMPDFFERESLPICESKYNEQEIYSADKCGDDPTEVFGIREYRIGDRQKQIHWKLSLKQRCLMVREFSLPINERYIIFLDFNVKDFSENTLTLIDNMLEASLSLSHYLKRVNISHSIAWFDSKNYKSDRIKIQSQRDIFRAARHLLALPIYEGEPKGKHLIKDESNILYFEPNVLPNIPIPISIAKGAKVS